MCGLSFAVFVILPASSVPWSLLGLLNLRKMKRKNFTVLKPRIFFCYRFLAVLFLSGSYFVVYAIDYFLSSEI